MLLLNTGRRVITHVAFAPDGPGLAASGWAGVFWWPDPAADPIPRQISTDPVWWIGVVPGGHYLVVAVRTFGVRILGLSGSRPRPLGLVGDVRLAVSPTAPLVVTRPPLDVAPMTAWRVVPRRPLAPLWTVENETDLSSLAFTADGSYFLYRDYRWWPKKRRYTSWLNFLDPATGERVRSVELNDSEAWADSSVSPDGNQLATLHTTRSGFSVRRLTTDPAPVVKTVGKVSTRDFTSLAYHPSGRRLAVTSNDTTVRLYETAKWTAAEEFGWEVGKLRCVAFNRDGTLAVAGSDTGNVIVWDVDL